MVRFVPLGLFTLLAVGCGARTAAEFQLDNDYSAEYSTDSGADVSIDSPSNPGPGGPPLDAYETGPSKENCVLCQTDHLCGFCKIGGLSSTYRCVITAPPPSPVCWTLSEQYTNNGVTYTCYYCD
jgi:hypothetical protein